jgi:hypothetical protein
MEMMRIAKTPVLLYVRRVFSYRKLLSDYGIVALQVLSAFFRN